MNNITKFKEISKSDFADKLSGLSKQCLFFEQNWQKQVENEFNYIKYKYFLYNSKFLLLVSVIDDKKLNATPLNDCGGVLPLSDELLDVDGFSSDCQEYFDNPFKIYVNSYVCPVADNKIDGDLHDYVVDLQKLSTIEEIKQNLRKTLRHVISKKPEFSINKCSNLVELAQIYKIYLQNLKQKKNLVLPFDLFKSLYESSEAEFLLAYDKKDIIGFSLFLNYPTHSHYFLSAVKFTSRNKNVAHHLLWYKLQTNFDKGIKQLQLGGTSRESSLSVFKRGWGSESKPIYLVTDGIEDNSKLKQSKLRDIYGMLPLFLLPVVSKLMWKKVL